ncbi:hypothetical protein HCU40_13365 [Pseudanabaena biceps]|nr:hypothetical protein [Pseudanabaena biceps]
MFAQFRSQYPQGRIQTEMLPKIDGLHAFRAIVSQGDAVMGTATALDSDLEIAEDRAVKRALAIAGVAFDNNYDDSYGNYGGRSPMLAQVSRESANVNSLPSANFNTVANLGSASLTAGHGNITHTTHTIQSETALDYAPEYTPDYGTDYTEASLLSVEMPAAPQQAIAKPVAPPISPEPVDLSNAISNIDVEMERLSWTKSQGRDYLVRTFDKKSRQQLTNEELLQFLSYLKSLPTPQKQVANDDFF